MRKFLFVAVTFAFACGQPSARLEKIQFSDSVFLRTASKHADTWDARFELGHAPNLHAHLDVTFAKSFIDRRVPVDCSLSGPKIFIPQKIRERELLPRGQTSATWVIAFPSPPHAGWVEGHYEVSCATKTSTIQGAFDVLDNTPFKPATSNSKTSWASLLPFGHTHETKTEPAVPQIVTPRTYATTSDLGDAETFADAFDASSLKYVGYEFDMPKAAGDYSIIGCEIERRSTGVRHFPHSATRLGAGTGLSFMGTMGYEWAGHWLPGEYELRCEGKGLTINLRASELGRRLPFPNARAAAINFIEFRDEPPPLKQRPYYSRFQRPRYIGAEVKLALDARDQTLPFNYRCNYFNEAGEIIGRGNVDVTIPAGETEYYAWVSWGNRDGNYWQSGTYYVECDADGFFLAARYFTVSR
jgi:hypothetical protein